MSNTTTVNEAVARPVRTAPQAVVAFAIVEFIDAFIKDLDERQYGAAVGLLVIIFAGLLVLIERGVGKSFLRAGEPPHKEVPVVADAGDSSEPDLNANAEIEVLRAREPGMIEDPDLGVPGPAEDRPVSEPYEPTHVNLDDDDELDGPGYR